MILHYKSVSLVGIVSVYLSSFSMILRITDVDDIRWECPRGEDPTAKATVATEERGNEAVPK